ncbi:MAG TPA: P-II family nitrogen regulator [Clostridia bacterium]|nr:P-II family nitrogen regulator [Clostridia bacterium]
MPSYAMLFTVFNRMDKDRFLEFYQEEDVLINFCVLGKGTASREILNYLGIGETEKIVCLSILQASHAKDLIHKLKTAMRIDKPGAIAFTIPLRSIGGISSLQALLRGATEESKGENKMEHCEVHHELVTVVVNKGYVDLVMEAARSAGASGGTSIHAIGTDAPNVEKFFGISIQNDKDIVLIVTEQENRQAVMKAIMAKAGSGTNAKAVCFSMPVTDVAGKEPPKEPAKEV